MKIKYLFASVIFLIPFLSCAKDTLDKEKEKYESYEGLSELIETKKIGEDFYLIDVRTKEEYEAGHIPGAELVPYNEIGDKFSLEEKDSLIILYCRSGNRANTALRTLSEMGYVRVYNFGGLSKWSGQVTKGEGP